MPGIFNRTLFSQWVASEKKDLVDQLNEKVLQILASHEAAPLDQAAARQIQGILRHREKTAD